MSLEIARFVLETLVRKWSLDNSKPYQSPRELSCLAEVVDHATHDQAVGNYLIDQASDGPGLFFSV
jgi:hypothetical protein